MQLTPEQHGNIVILTPAERLDHAHADAFAQAMTPWLAKCAEHELALVLDFSKMPYISSIGLRVLMLAAKDVKSRRGQLVLAGLQPLVAEVFQISGFHFYFKIFHGRRDAIAMLATRHAEAAA